MKLKHLLLPLAFLAAVGGGVQLFRQFTPPELSETQVGQSLETAFPKDTAIPVDVETPTGSSELLTRRELRDQIRDWLLLTVLTTSGLDPEKLNDITFDLPPVRYSFMKPVADWEFGAVRSRAIGNGTVIALIPAKAGSRRLEYLSDIADQNRKNLGQRPTRVIVMEYEIDPGFTAATLTRRETVDGAALFSAESGYIERQIKTLGEFKSFQNAVDDLTYAAVRDDAVILGGRRIPGRPIRGIKTADVAALWQAEDKLTVASEQYKKFVAQKEKELEDRWKDRTYRRGDYLEEARLRRQLEADQAAVVEELQAYRKKQGVSDSLGFSLDPAYDYGRMADFVAVVLPRLPVDTSKQNNKENAFSPDRGLLRGLEAVDRTSSGLSSIAVAKVVAGLRSGSTHAFFEALQKLEGKLGEEFYNMCEQRFGLQAARYDGDLQHTEPGMVLFYTDLLAKLWALDYVRSAPEDQIEDFIPLTRVKVSPVFRKELEELRHTRLWFGPQNKGFQITANKEVILSRNATRLYAASATSLKQGQESAPNAQTAAFLGWWDDHYEEVARFEPEYERLNEIMKWSLVLGWLHQNNDLQTLSFLKDVKVQRDNWFPDWVRRHPELRFQQWEKIKFFPKGAFGLKTEALPRLRSAEFEQFGEPGHYMAGGVSLANRATFAERPLLSTRVAEGLRRSNLKYTETAGSGFKTLEGVDYNFARSANRYDVAIKPAAEMRLRGRVGELANQPINRTLEVSAGRFEYRARAADAQIGSLNIGKSANGFKVGWTGRDLDAGYSLGRRLSTSQDLAGTLARDQQVTAFTRLSDGTYIAHVRGSNRWVRFAEENQVSSKLEGEWQARVAGFDRNAKSVKMQWVDDAWVKDKLGTDKFDQLVQQAQGRLKPGEQLADLMYRRDLHEAAQRISRDPLVMYAEMDKVYRVQLARADELVRAGKPAETAEYLTYMERTWGATTDISARRAIMLADSKDFAGAARTIERPAVGRARSIDSVYEELARRIQRSATHQEAQNWEAIRDAAEWKMIGRVGRPRLVAEGDRLSLEFHLTSDAAKGQRVPVEEAIHSRAPVYVQDSPQLRNLDWSVDVHQTMRQAVDGDLATVVRLRRVDVAHFRPAKIYSGDDTAVLKKVDSRSNTGVHAGQNAYRSFGSSGCYSNDGSITAGSNSCPEDRQAVYLVIPKESEHRYE
jgi:hypothetical protein